MQLWLNFINENGVAKRVLVTGESFSIGRTSDNDLQIALASLSRQHARIERFDDIYTISDCGSSNGSTLNGESLNSPLQLKNGDKVNLGDEVDIKIELVSEQSASPKSAAVDDDDDNDDDVSSSASVSASNLGGNNSLLIGCFILVPVLGLLALLIGGGIFIISKNTDQPEVVENTNARVNTDDTEDFPTNSKVTTPEKSETPTTTSTTSPTTTTSPGGTSTPQPTDTIVTTPKPSGDTEKVEFNSRDCLRRIAQNDPKAFLTTEQISFVTGKIGEFKGSSALAENLRNGKKDAAKITEMANSQNLKPQFLLIAALTKLGNQRGNVAETASGMLESLSNISKPFGNESANEVLLVIAAYSSNTSGESLQNTAGSLTQKNNDSARAVRSIWYFKKNGKLTEPQFEFAIKFLAVGTIVQNPKDFGVQAESVVLN